MATRFRARMRSFAVMLATSSIVLGVPTVAQAPSLAMLDGLQKGEWEIRYRTGEPTQRICLRTGRELIQLKHRQAGCNRFVVEDAQGEVTVQYTCPGDGYGRTNIRRESAVLVQLETQGIADGRPFSATGEGRRMRPCP
ncbi:hypothetical protein WAB17_05245 [Parerythrobacter aurantius]|uniref:DUF3617 domain-containing protein n=1 Tax=Parerythrobacter aurantius TaxID=3127706 RepID=UPI00325595F5